MAHKLSNPQKKIFDKMRDGYILSRSTVGPFRLTLDDVSEKVNREPVESLLRYEVIREKNCTDGMRARPDGGCYNSCYAAKIAKFRGIDFTVAIARVAYSPAHRREIEREVITARELSFSQNT